MINKAFPNYEKKYKRLINLQTVKFEEEFNRHERRTMGKKQGRKIMGINKPYVKAV